MNNLEAEKYNLRGVSSSKHQVHAALEGTSKGIYPQAFVRSFPISLQAIPNIAW